MSGDSDPREGGGLVHGFFPMRDEADEAAFLAGLREFIGPEEPDDRGETS